MTTPNLGANEFTFTGDRTDITYFPTAPGPIAAGQEGGRLEYHGIEGNFTFSGNKIELQESPFGTLVTVAFESNPDIGIRTFTILLPQVSGVTRENMVTFEALAIKTTGQGFTLPPFRPGAKQTYTILPLLGTAKEVILPL